MTIYDFQRLLHACIFTLLYQCARQEDSRQCAAVPMYSCMIPVYYFFMAEFTDAVMDDGLFLSFQFLDRMLSPLLIIHVHDSSLTYPTIILYGIFIALPTSLYPNLSTITTTSTT